ncbi:Bug family tripartite tricarboxylate transporter substrate binding protein [Ramlibacter alkalitolerans]|uniref:Tripartite tricarboxylate transporter substrate binding protein n=1 Tax=Ramlibacter alkalitolerans TaxID=2039631 RepID=A0ABS1JMH2_9BURK|nr:tripartite tricarboxylate transporter substrate binding protein [Ramlibacter alkalitolerans]MBL0425086.1 tripartite tricarboxylate transporter substrate binding protein [Ramlibacter alkalitolerans]
MFLQRFAAVLLLAACTAGPAAAQSFPARPVKLVVPQTPGGASDALARIVGQKLSERWGQPVVVENKPGAGGNVGTDFVAKSPADGYTLLMSYVGTQAINGSLYKSLPYDPYKDFVTVATVATVPFAMVVHQNFPPKTVAELVAYARAHPGQVNFGSAGNGSLNQLLGEMVNMSQGTKLVHVPYKGAAGALTDTIAGQIQMTFASLPSVAGHIRGEKVRALAVTGAHRSAAFPNVPTLGEAGLQGFELSPWFGLLAPAGTPEAVVRKINADVAEVLRDRDLLDKFAANGADPFATSPEQFGMMLAADIQRWSQVVRTSGARID